MVRHTACRHCGQDIEGFSPWPKGEWRDRGNNTHCNDGQVHAPEPEQEETRFANLEVGEPFLFASQHLGSMARGPWIKISARRYSKDGLVHRVGTIKVFVRRVLEP